MNSDLIINKIKHTINSNDPKAEAFLFWIEGAWR